MIHIVDLVESEDWKRRPPIFRWKPWFPLSMFIQIILNQSFE